MDMASQRYSNARRRLIAAGALVAVGAMLAACSSGGGSNATSGASTGSAAAGATGHGTTGASGAASPSAQAMSYGSIPAESGTPKDGGTVDIAQAVSAGPYYILPITPGSFYSVYVIYDFQDLMYRPLYWFPKGGSPEIDSALSLADPPTYSNGDKTVTIHLKSGYTWSNGDAVTADDVVFAIDLLKAALKKNAANWGGYTPGQFPDNVTKATASGADTVTLQLDAAYNPNWFSQNELVGLTPMPSKAWARSSAGGALLDYTQPHNAQAIYAYLDKESRSPATFASNSLWQTVDGPYHLTSFDATTNAYSMAANSKYSGPQKPRIQQLNFLPFTSDTAEFNQLLTGKLTMGRLDASHLSQVPALEAEGYTIYGAPQLGFNFIMLNFKDKTNNVDKLYAQLYIRQTLQHLVDEPGYIKSKGVYNGAAIQSYGTAPATSPFAPDNISIAPYPYDPAAATQLLTQHGWKVVPNGATTCQNPGTGPSQCGAGIPQGQTIDLNLFYVDSPPAPGAVSTAFASAARSVGIKVTIAPKTFSFLIQNFNLPAAPSKADDWAMETWGGFSGGGAYPTSSGIFNTTGSENVGGYSDPKADKLINASVNGNDPNAVQAEMAYLRTNLPVLWLPTADQIWAWKTTLSGPTDAFANLPTSVLTPEYWYMKQ